MLPCKCLKSNVDLLIVTFAFILPFSSFSSDFYNDSSDNISDPVFDHNSTNNFSVEFNQSSKSLNDTFYSLNNTYFDNQSSIKPDLVVTEDWENAENTESREKIYFTLTDEEICTCDLTSNACDLNCCCDLDCSEDDMIIFTKCQHQVLIPDKNYCYQKDIIYRNNTAYLMVKDPESQLFCIVHDNLKQHLRFKDMPTLKSDQDLNTLLKYQSKFIYSWNSGITEKKKNSFETKIGSPIYVYNSSHVQPKVVTKWKLPSSCFSRTCSCEEEIHYLEDFHSSCSQIINNLEEECEKNAALSVESYTNFCIDSRNISPDSWLQLKDLITHTKAVKENNNSTQTTLLCVKLDNRKPKYARKEDVCYNILNSVTFTIYHNGYHGISSIHPNFKWINATLGKESFLQHFDVVFQWNNVSAGFKRSGNPGYQTGLPILVKSTNSTELDEVTKSLSVFGKDGSNFCGGTRKIIRFGQNYQTSCHFKISESNCKVVQDKIYHSLLGQSEKRVFVGVFGNSNHTNYEDWIEAYHDDQEMSFDGKVCSLITVLNINIAHAAVGTVNNPQHKILGMGYHYSKIPDFDISCSPSCKPLLLSTSVSFIDFTEPAIAHYPKAPVIRATLPDDFFYPFTSGTQGHISDFQAHFSIFAMLFFGLILHYGK